jgi:hypothetical protein
MNKLVTSALIVLPLFATAAVAATPTDTGMIKRINTAKGVIQLADGKTFQAAKSLKLSAFKPKEKVTVVYKTTKGKMMATSVVAAK